MTRNSLKKNRRPREEIETEEYAVLSTGRGLTRRICSIWRAFNLNDFPGYGVGSWGDLNLFACDQR